MRITQVKKKNNEMTAEEFAIIYHYLSNKRSISSLIMRAKYISLTKKNIYKNSKQGKQMQY